MNSIMGYEASDEDIAACNPGMRTLRDEFAMAALTGVIGDTNRFGFSHRSIAEEAYGIADAMMEAR